MESKPAEVLRKTFGFDEPAGNQFDPFKVLPRAISNFEKFAAGRYFWFIVDLKNNKHVCGGGEIETMTPLTRSDFFNTDQQKLHDITHPDDLPQIIAFSEFWIRYFLTLPEKKRSWVNMSLYVRVQNARCKYNWVMVQYSHGIPDDNNQYAYGTVFVTEIAHLKKAGQALMNIPPTPHSKSHQFVCTQQKELPEKKPLYAPTLRQKQILNYLAMGYTSKQIANELNLSIKTIDNHRQNMLHQTESKSTGELLSHCIMNGYL